MKNALRNASRASQAVGPPLSPFELSFGGRTLPDLGKKMLIMQPLANQHIAQADSVLGGLSNISVTPTVEDLLRGGADPLGRPLAFSQQFAFEALDSMDIPFPILGAPIRDRVPCDTVLPPTPECTEDILGVREELTGPFIPVCEDRNGDGEQGAGAAQRGTDGPGLPQRLHGHAAGGEGRRPSAR